MIETVGDFLETYIREPHELSGWAGTVVLVLIGLVVGWCAYDLWQAFRPRKRR